MIFYATLFSGKTDTVNQFFVRRDYAVALGKECAALGDHVDVRVVKLQPKGHKQVCELFNIASGHIPMHVDAEVVWRNKPAVVKAPPKGEDTGEDLF